MLDLSVEKFNQKRLCCYYADVVKASSKKRTFFDPSMVFEEGGLHYTLRVTLIPRSIIDF